MDQQEANAQRQGIDETTTDLLQMNLYPISPESIVVISGGIM